MHACGNGYNYVQTEQDDEFLNSVKIKYLCYKRTRFFETVNFLYRWFSCNLRRHKQQWWNEQMLVDKQSELMSDLLFTIHQHGGDDVTWKPPILLNLIYFPLFLHVSQPFRMSIDYCNFSELFIYFLLCWVVFMPDLL